MVIQLGDKPQPDFHQPIELMMDCHRRIERFLEILLRVVTDTGGQRLDEEHRQALETALRYFRQAAPRHTEDEEASLFPRMRRSDDPRVQQALAQLDALEADHRKAEAAHAEVDQLGRKWLGQGGMTEEEASRLRELLNELRDAYRQHIAIEDEQLFPLAASILAEDQLQAVGREMATRRATDPGRPGSRCAQRRRLSQGTQT